MKLFGREPAFWLGVLQATLGALLVFNVFGLNPDHSTLLQAASAAVFGLVAAFFTKQVNLAVAVGAAQAVLAALVGFGLNLGPDQTAAIIGALQFILAGFLRQNTEPAVDPGLNSEPLSTEPLVFEESVDGMPSEQAYV